MHQHPSSRLAPVTLQRRTLTSRPAVCRTDHSGKPVAAAEFRADKAAIFAKSLAQRRNLDL